METERGEGIGQQSCDPYASAALSPKEIPWSSFLLQPEWNPGLMNAERKNRWLENFQESYEEETRNLPSCGVMPQTHAPQLTPN